MTDTYYFAKDGKQVKGQTVSAGNGRISYYYGDSGKRAVSTWVEIQPGVYVYFDKNGLAYPPESAKLIDLKRRTSVLFFIFSRKRFFLQLQVAYMTDF